MEASSSVVQDAWLWSGSRKILLTEESDVGDVDMQDEMYDMGVEADEALVQVEGTASGSPDQLINLEGVTVDDVLQIEFSTPEEASGFYNNYNRLKGRVFERRNGWKKLDRKREHKVVTRCGCLAEMRIKKKDETGNWYVSRFIDEHNHEMVSEKFVNYLRSHRKISEVEIAQLTNMRGIGISIPKIYESFAAQLGGFNKVSFTKQDMYNEIRRQRELQGGDSMVDECGVVDVEWVKDLYRKKNSWATAYIRGRFFAGIRTTSRCESLHAKLGRFVESRYRVLEFVTNFQRCIDFLHDNEDELEFRSCYGTPVLQTEFVELKKSGWSKFTQEMFWRFRESLRRCVRVRIFESKVTDQCHIYRIEKYRRPDMRWIVVWEPVTNNFRCTCMRMESFGLPCVHILAVCVKLDLCALPDSLVLRRWAKTAKLTIGSGEETTDHAATYRSRLGAFSQICKRLGWVACMSDEDFKQYSKKLLSDAVVLEI
ncbi:hypothetical protein Ahy_B06g082333 [Arachis hypogaea]|uniref:SWIM-type domain-containing protein n=1 Tax=Arachis hypogaea TaxID=3818 RepID=A0A444YN86_ARAHY|nr:hypothetical protein Ahy_B06g082333 [Arachis hypogaea]